MPVFERRGGNVEATTSSIEYIQTTLSTLEKVVFQVSSTTSVLEQSETHGLSTLWIFAIVTCTILFFAMIFAIGYKFYLDKKKQERLNNFSGRGDLEVLTHCPYETSEVSSVASNEWEIFMPRHDQNNIGTIGPDSAAKMFLDMRNKEKL